MTESQAARSGAKRKSSRTGVDSKLVREQKGAPGQGTQAVDKVDPMPHAAYVLGCLYSKLELALWLARTGDFRRVSNAEGSQKENVIRVVDLLASLLVTLAPVMGDGVYRDLSAARQELKKSAFRLGQRDGQVKWVERLSGNLRALVWGALSQNPELQRLLEIGEMLTGWLANLQRNGDPYTWSGVPVKPKELIDQVKRLPERYRSAVWVFGRIAEYPSQPEDHDAKSFLLAILNREQDELDWLVFELDAFINESLEGIRWKSNTAEDPAAARDLQSPEPTSPPTSPASDEPTRSNSVMICAGDKDFFLKRGKSRSRPISLERKAFLSYFLVKILADSASETVDYTSLNKCPKPNQHTSYGKTDQPAHDEIASGPLRKFVSALNADLRSDLGPPPNGKGFFVSHRMHGMRLNSSLEWSADTRLRKLFRGSSVPFSPVDPTIIAEAQQNPEGALPDRPRRRKHANGSSSNG